MAQPWPCGSLVKTMTRGREILSKPPILFVALLVCQTETATPAPVSLGHLKQQCVYIMPGLDQAFGNVCFLYVLAYISTSKI